MTRRGVWVAATAVLVLAGCNRDGTGDGVAATVGGEKITQAQISAELRAAGGDATNAVQRTTRLQQIIARKLYA